MLIAEWKIGKDLERSVSGAVDLLSRDLHGGTKEEAQNFSVILASFPFEIQAKHLPLQV